MIIFPEFFFYKSICSGYSFELHQQVDAIQMGTTNTYFNKEIDKTYTGSNMKTTELPDCTLIGVCAVIMSNMVFCLYMYTYCLSLFKMNI